MKCGILAASGCALLALAAMTGAPAAAQAGVQTVANADGLLPVRVNAAEGRILVTLPAPDREGISGRFLHATALRTGLGSAAIRLDHAMNGPTRILAFRRLGKKIAISFENPRFRATGDAAGQTGARESFPFSTVWMADIVSTEPDGGVVIDIAPFLTRDVMDIAGSLNEGGKGFKLVDSLSAADPGSVKIFPDNIEMEAVQTFQSETPGKEVETIASDPRQVSFVVHHSLVRLPDAGYQPRRFDIRAGGFGSQVFDFGTPLGQDVVYQLANRFRVEKIDPTAARSRVKKPIIFYIDRAAPEPVRTALAEGVGWWSQAFDAAGLIDAFQVKILPEGVDPLDVRYNVVNWDNRLTRGWSYGQVIADPRTGEIVKGSVLLGSLRVRQDMIIFEGLVGAGEDNSGGPNDPVRASLARIRQLGAHEVGHALGFVHNFAGSTQGRSSVMDYPAPRIGLTNGRIDLSDAYATGIGDWDKFTVDWLYGQPAPGVDPDAAAHAKAAALQASGMRFVTDIDGRAPDTPNPWGSMWDDGPDPTAELIRMMAVRRVAITNFGPGVLRQYEPLANLRRKFVPVWLLHRYQVDAVAKLIGGMDYAYAVAGDGRPPAAAVPAATQYAALDALLATLSATELAVPDRLVGPLSSGVNGRSDPQYDIEIFKNAGAAMFDPLVAADVAAQVTLDTLLAPSRLIRVYEQHRRDASLLGLDALLDRLMAATVDARHDAVGRRIAHRTIVTLARTARDPATSVDVAAVIDDRLRGLADRLARSAGKGEDAAWCRSVAHLLRDDERLERELAKRPRAPAIPAGMPIGGAEMGWIDEL
ncbi:peptidase [Sphingomonas oleivorans]|uniref:Peptidase n=1 Tax=Sphingomonas oleivorans TaxID=1735121 RepID=A0A2T5FUD2_9SPHN|nr:zinc-dependent metalloprotease [Sphingomonas oleivorans]PTQ07887.1 peptidase [Sphingomonas oleivorans]